MYLFIFDDNENEEINMIGIITFHRAVNYGAVLQCFALQQTLDELEIENRVIDYRCQFIEDHYSCIPTVSPAHIRQFIKECFQIPIKFRCRKNFDDFLKRNLRMSSKYTRREILSGKCKFDTFITGSDQVWNLEITGNDTTYLLDFVSENAKKISYAASLGPAEIAPRYLNEIQKYIKKFDVVSLREPSAIEMIKKISNKKVEVDVDPTVLLDINVWIALVNKSKMKANKFIFVYLMQDSSILREKALQIEREENLEIRFIGMVDNIPVIGKNMKGASVEDFLWMIKNAEYVITNSFHGIMFSMRFEKQFYWAYQTGKKMSNPRFQMLNQYYGIEKCCCNNQDLRELDYEYIRNKMDEQREQSITNIKKYILESN